jgi:hypothetical protein
MRDYCNSSIEASEMEFCNGGERLGRTEYSMTAWESITMEQSGVTEWKITKRKHQGKGDFSYINWARSTEDRWMAKEPDPLSKVIRC